MYKLSSLRFYSKDIPALRLGDWVNVRGNIFCPRDSQLKGKSEEGELFDVDSITLHSGLAEEGARNRNLAQWYSASLRKGNCELLEERSPKRN